MKNIDLINSLNKKYLDSKYKNENCINFKCYICDKKMIFKGINNFKLLVGAYNESGWNVYEKHHYCNKCSEQYNKLNDKTCERPSKHVYYLNIAKEVSTRSTCLRKKYGSVIVKNDTIISTGYNGSPRLTMNCIDLGYCRREQMNIPRGERYELCRSVHSEMNAIINAEREKMIDSTLYLYGSDIDGNIIENLESCQMCKKIIINAGIKYVVFARPNDNFIIKEVNDWIINDETLTDKMGY